MAPPTKSFPSSALESQISLDHNDRRRKMANGKAIDLAKCEVVNQVVQYMCDVVGEDIMCYPVPRTFRRCHDKKGSFMVETTAWEKTQIRKSEK